MYTLPNEAVTRLQARLSDEWTAVHFYNCGAMFFADANFDGLAAYCLEESADERQHAMGIQDHLTGWNIVPTIEGVVTNHTFTSVQDFFEKAYELEYDLRKKYDADYIALEEYPSCQIFITKYIAIQEESVITYSNFLRKLKGIQGEFELRQMEEVLLNK